MKKNELAVDDDDKFKEFRTIFRSDTKRQREEAGKRGKVEST